MAAKEGEIEFLKGFSASEGQNGRLKLSYNGDYSCELSGVHQGSSCCLHSFTLIQPAAQLTFWNTELLPKVQKHAEKEKS